MGRLLQAFNSLKGGGQITKWRAEPRGRHRCMPIRRKSEE